MEKTKEIQKKKMNARLYPLYKMISWDLLFYYSIIYLYLTQTKNFSASQVLLGDAFFTASCFFLEIPIGIAVDRLGKKKSLVFANVCMCIFTFILLIVQNYTQLLIAYFIDAIGYVIKCVCETNILYDSLPMGKGRGSLYSALDGKGASRYYIIDAITSLVAGYAFVVNSYLPIILCLIANIISTVLSTRFIDLQNQEVEPKKKGEIRRYFKGLKEATKFAFKSKRMLCLLLFFGLLSGLIYNMTSFRSGVLKQISLPEQYFGIVFAISQIMAAIFSGMQKFIQKKFGNKTLSALGIPFVVSCVIIGILVLLFNEKAIKIVVIMFILQGAIKGAYNVLIYRYLNNFTNKEIRVKLATIRNMIFNLFSILISLFGSWLLGLTTSANTLLIIGFVTTAFMLWLLYYMRDKVGLQPEEYNKEDLKYSQL